MDRLGERLIAEVRPADSDLQSLHELLVSYGEVLDAAVEQVQSDLRLAPSFRVENTGTILEKLRCQSGSGLRNMQDVAGMRLVDDWTFREQDAVADELVREFSDEERTPRVSDRREHPSHGYRAVHVVVFPDHVPIEIQVRTRRQHEWAEVFSDAVYRIARRDTAATWVITDADDVVVAYASVAMTGIDRSTAPPELIKVSPDPVPALLLGRLAVDRHYAGLGLGTALAAHVLATAAELNEKAACRAVVVSALNPKARTWWERLGSHPFYPDDSTELDLYLLTSEIEATLRTLR